MAPLRAACGHFRLLPLVTLALLRIVYRTALGLLPFANKKPLARATKVADSASDLREYKPLARATKVADRTSDLREYKPLARAAKAADRVSDLRE